ncbi:MAG: radical SAM protein [Candidatus Firestonebacteria bacterium]
MGILCLGTYLKENNYDVHLIDSRLYAKDEFESILSKEIKGVFLVGISVMTSYIKEALKVLNFVKQYDSKIKTVLGGIHPSLFPEQTVQHPLVDFVIFGEGELPLLELAKKLYNNEDSFEEIGNLYFKNGKDIVFKRISRFIDINDLPVPDYNLVDAERYITKRFSDGNWGRQLEYQSSRGCPSRCSFCVNTIISKRYWRQKDPEKVVREVEALKERFALDSILFMDENFFPKKKNVETIAIELKKMSVKWEANCRADYFKDRYIDNDFLKFLSSCGLTTVRIGIESGSLNTLKLLKKDINKTDIINAAKICSQNNVFACCSFMIGLPYETKKDVIETLNIISRIESIGKNYIIIIGPQVFRPYPGGELYEFCKKEGLLEPHAFDEWGQLIFLDTGYIDNFYWIKNKNFIKLIVLLRSLAQDVKIEKRNWPFLKKCVRGFLCFFVKYRVKYGFYHCLLDMRLAYIFKKFSRGLPV